MSSVFAHFLFKNKLRNVLYHILYNKERNIFLIYSLFNYLRYEINQKKNKRTAFTYTIYILFFLLCFGRHTNISVFTEGDYLSSIY